MHHGPEAFPVPDDLLRVFGATKQFPDGRLRPDDEGEIQFGVSVEGSSVVLHFGPNPVAWVGMSRRQAEVLAEILRQRASEIAG